MVKAQAGLHIERGIQSPISQDTSISIHVNEETEEMMEVCEMETVCVTFPVVKQLTNEAVRLET